MYHKGKYSDLKNPKKYVGDPKNITYRSHWERNVMRWADLNDEIVEWASEEIAIPYNNPMYNRRARYYPDFFFKYKDGSTQIVEVKPKAQTSKPKKPKKTSEKYLKEMMVWAVNCEKWDAAVKLSEKNDFVFEIWTEETLERMGILKWKTEDRKLISERTASKKPKFKVLASKKKPRPRPKRKS